MRRKKLLLLFPLILSCNKTQSNNVNTLCSVQEIESNITNSLDSQSSSTDFTVRLEKSSGQTYTYNRGASTLDTVYESASTSKWISAALILWTVDQVSVLDLSDSPNEHYAWSLSSSDPLYSLNLDQLLSFTSGLQEDANCLKFGTPEKNYDACINDSFGSLVSVNAGNGFMPNSSFHYSASHLQLAGAMAVAAGSFTDWQDLFSSFKTATGLFPNSTYSLPSTTNPRLAGGMTWNGRDYMNFLKAVFNQSFLSSASHTEMLKDQVTPLSISYSPAFDGLGEQWHYGYGVWLECPNSTFNCSNIEYYSSPGAYGAYPFINFNKNFFGIVSRQGSLGTYTEGVNLYRNIRVLAESWADCN